MYYYVPLSGDREVFDVVALNAVNALHLQAHQNIDDEVREPPLPPLRSPAPQPPLPPLPQSRDEDEPNNRQPSDVTQPVVDSIRDSPPLVRPRALSTSSSVTRGAESPEQVRLVDQMIERLVQEQQQQIHQSFGANG